MYITISICCSCISITTLLLLCTRVELTVEHINQRLARSAGKLLVYDDFG